MNFGQLLEETYIALRQVRRRGKATDGSETTIVDTTIADKYRDDDLNDSPFFISYAGGAAPEHEYGLVSDYAETGQIITVPTLTAAVAALNKYTLMQTRYNLYEVEKICNQALQEIGEFPYVDTSLTTSTQQTEYTMPAALEGYEVTQVEVQGKEDDANDNEWGLEHGTRIVPSAVGTAETIEFSRQPPDSRTIRIWYLRPHEQLTAFSDSVNKYLHPQLAVAACRYKVLEYLGVWDEEQEASLQIQRAEAAYAKMLDKYDIRRGFKKQPFLAVGRW